MNSKFNKTFKKILRINNITYELNDSIFQSNNNLTDILNENILPSPYKLIDKISENLTNNINKFSINKILLKNLSDKNWKYYPLIDSLPQNFLLTIIKCNEYELINKFSYINPIGLMMEFCNKFNDFDEYIWIGNYFKNYYQQDFQNLLKHELGHVWTFIFGKNDENFIDGQAPFNSQKILNINNFNHFQMDVFKNFYNSNLKLLSFDYTYILCKADNEDSANFELAVHIDNIIEILIADYLENSNDTTIGYLNMIFNILEKKLYYSFSNFSLINVYKNNKLFQGYTSINSIKNPIRRLFLIFAFGTQEQIKYFKQACIKQFGNIE